MAAKRNIKHPAQMALPLGDECAAEEPALKATRQRRRGVYLGGEDRERAFVLLRAAGHPLKTAAELLKYTLREAYDLNACRFEEIGREADYLDIIKPRHKGGKL